MRFCSIFINKNKGLWCFWCCSSRWRILYFIFVKFAETLRKSGEGKCRFIIGFARVLKWTEACYCEVRWKLWGRKCGASLCLQNVIYSCFFVDKAGFFCKFCWELRDCFGYFGCAAVVSPVWKRWVFSACRFFMICKPWAKPWNFEGMDMCRLRKRLNPVYCSGNRVVKWRVCLAAFGSKKSDGSLFGLSVTSIYLPGFLQYAGSPASKS